MHRGATVLHGYNGIVDIAIATRAREKRVRKSSNVVVTVVVVADRYRVEARLHCDAGADHFLKANALTMVSNQSTY